MRKGLLTSLLAAVVALAPACGGEPRPTLGPAPGAASTAPSTAPPQLADAQAAVRDGLASLRSFRADVIVTSTVGGPGEIRVAVERTADGLFKEIHTKPVERAYFSDARQGWDVTYQIPPPDMGRGTARRRTNISVGPPTPPPHFDNIRPDPVALAREVLGWEEARVSREDVSGRAVWVVQGSTPNSFPELRVATIDDQTGLALRYDALQGGQPVYQVRVENLTTNLDAEPAYAVPAGVSVSTLDVGHARTTLDQAGRAAGFVPLVPGWLPSGFTPAEVAVSTGQARRPTMIGMAFRRGMDVVLVQVALRPAVQTIPPISVRSGERFDPEGNLHVPPRREQVRLSAGALAGVEAERSVGGTSGLSASTDTLSVDLHGDVTPDEIMRIAESLQPTR